MTATTRTFSTAYAPDAPSGTALRDYACLFSRAVRTAYAGEERAVRAGIETTKTERKAAVQNKFQMTSRQANAVLVEADGKRKGIQELYQTRLSELQPRMKKKQRQLVQAQTKLGRHKEGKTFKLKPEGVTKVCLAVYNCKTTIAHLSPQIKQIQEMQASGQTHLTFGTKKLARQRPLVDPAGTDAAIIEGLGELALWNAEWQHARNSQFLVVGSKDETAGCQGCVATAAPSAASARSPCESDGRAFKGLVRSASVPKYLAGAGLKGSSTSVSNLLTKPCTEPS